jgi:hypothetical protein
MDFIERMFGVAPDNGDGSLEVLWLAGLAIAVCAIAFRRRIIAWMARWSTR